MPPAILCSPAFFLFCSVFSIIAKPSALVIASPIPARTTATVFRFLSAPYVRIPVSHHKEHSKESLEVHLDASLDKSSRIYQSTATLTALPDQPNRMVQMLFSIIISNTNFTQPINTAIIECVVNVTSTPQQHLGVYRAEPFTSTQIQAEFFADVSEKDSITFPEKLDPYIRSGNLTQCVRDKRVAFPPEAALLSGRTTIAPRTEEIVSSTGSIPGWAVGALIGVLALLAIIALVAMAVPGNAIYPEDDYEQEAIESGDTEPNIDENGLPRGVTSNISAQLKEIAGQRRGALLAPS